MQKPNAADEDRALLTGFLPARWAELAHETSALKGLRQDKSPGDYLRVLLLHLGCRHSLRETAARARQAGLTDFSDVALLKRLRKSKDWLRALCEALFAERQPGPAPDPAPALRLIDSTVVREPGRTGSQWRIHYSLRWPGLACDHFELTPIQGGGTGESLTRHPLRAGDHVLADRGYCRAGNFHHAAGRGAVTLVRLNPAALRLETGTGEAFPLLARLATVTRPGQVREWPVRIPLEGAKALPARLCLIRKSEAAVKVALKKLRHQASKDQHALRPETERCARFVMVLTTFPARGFPTARVLECYRLRWQVELLFKRFKQLAQLGHLPKHDAESAQAWLYGKLFVALLTEKLLAHARAFSPWGYGLPPPPEPVA